MAEDEAATLADGILYHESGEPGNISYGALSIYPRSRPPPPSGYSITLESRLSCLYKGHKDEYRAEATCLAVCRPLPLGAWK
jgi:hypothetical protein